nr:hypothetical protein GCM10020093_002480 [Planobispora longispora]
MRGADGVTAKNRLESAGFYSFTMVAPGGGAVSDPAAWRVAKQSPEPDRAVGTGEQITLEMVLIPSF